MTQRRHVLVSGRVQGVWFRASLQQEARRASVAGWARNLADGRVEAVFEGTAEAISHMTAWCEGGPPGARVTSVEIRDEAAEGLEGFRIVG